MHREASDETADRMAQRWAAYASAINDYYDSFAQWNNVTQALDALGILRDDEEYAKFAAPLAETPRLVLDALRGTSLKRKEDVSNAIAALAGPSRADPRVDYLRRLLLNANGRSDEALAGLPQPPEGPDERLAYFGFLLDINHKLRANATRTSDAACLFIEAVGGLAESDGFSRAETALMLASLGGSISESLADDGQVGAGRKVLQKYATGGLPREDLAGAIAAVNEGFPVTTAVFAGCCQVLEAMCIHTDSYAEAIDVMQSELASTPGSGREAILSRIADFAALTGDREAVAGAVEFARANDVRAIAAQYDGIGGRLEDQSLAHKFIPGIIGVRTHWTTPMWEPQEFGPCLVNSTRILFDFWGRKLNQDEVVKGYAAARRKAPGSHAFVIEFFKAQGMDVQYFAPSERAARAILDCDVPIFLLHQASGGGYTSGHASVIFGYDDRVRKIFLRESGESGEARIPYDDLCECDAMIVVGPPANVAKVRERAGSCATATPPRPFSQNEIEALRAGDAALEYWACWTNAFLAGDAGHVEDFISWGERARGIRRPRTSLLDEKLASALLSQDKPEKALQYVRGGLEIDPDSLVLSYFHAQIRGRLYRGSKESIDPALALELLAVTDRMESTDPAYPDTYYLRGRIALAARRKELALTSFQRYLNHYRGTGIEYRQRNLPLYSEVVEQVSTLRRELLEKALFDSPPGAN